MMPLLPSGWSTGAMGSSGAGMAWRGRRGSDVCFHTLSPRCEPGWVQHPPKILPVPVPTALQGFCSSGVWLVMLLCRVPAGFWDPAALLPMGSKALRWGRARRQSKASQRLLHRVLFLKPPGFSEA